MQVFRNQNNRQLSIESLVKDVKREGNITGKIIVDKNYQREFVWNDLKMKRDLVMSIIFDRPLGNIILWRREFKDNFPELQIVDGQQRIKTIIEFKENKFSLDESYIKKIKEDQQINNLLIKAFNEQDDKISGKMLSNSIKKLAYKDMPKFLKETFDEFQLNITDIMSLKKEDIVEYFRVLQNQEKLKAGEMLHSINDNVLSTFLSKNEIDKFCLLTNFNNQRMAFTKHFSVFMGIIIDKTKMGLEDKLIVKMAEKLNLADFENNEEFFKILRRFKEDLNSLSRLIVSFPKNKNKLNVIGLKVLLLTYMDEFYIPEYSNISLESKNETIKLLTKMVGYWNSNDESKKDTLIDKIKNESSDWELIISGIKNVWKISRTTHSKTELIAMFNDIKHALRFITNNANFNYEV